MRFFIVVSLLNFLIITEKAHALDTKELKETLRPYIEEYFGKETSNKWLGEKKVEIPMPPIPKIDSSATNTDVYEASRLIEKNDVEVKDKEKYDLAFINELFLATRMTKANDDDIAKWMNVMAQGATREGVYRALVLDNTYAGLENFNKPVTKKVIDFANYYLPKFVGQSVGAEVLNQINFFTLKRLTAEKALEVIDAYGTSESDLFTWYSIFSVEVARKYPYVWENKLRMDDNFNRHKNWVSNVPRQHLKSEVVIKIHKIFNALMQ